MNPILRNLLAIGIAILPINLIMIISHGLYDGLQFVFFVVQFR